MEEKSTKLEYSIIMPAFNEGDKVSSSITQVLNFMRTYCNAFELIVVDDGSTDNTADIVSDMMQDNIELNLLKVPHKGKGAALFSGMKKASGDLISMTDVDQATPISELKKLSVWVKENNYDVVIASREGFGAQRIKEPAFRHLIGRIFNIIVQIIALPGINDSQCGFKLFKKAILADILSRLEIYGPKAPVLKRPFFGVFDVELLYVARKLKFKIKEVPVTWTYIKTTRLNFFENSIRMVFDVIKVRLNDVMGVYKKTKNTQSDFLSLADINKPKA